MLRLAVPAAALTAIDSASLRASLSLGEVGVMLPTFSRSGLDGSGGLLISESFVSLTVVVAVS